MSLMYLSLKQPRYQGLRAETQVSDLEALRLFREASGMNLEEVIDRPEAAITFFINEWGVESHGEEIRTIPAEQYLFRWDISEKVFYLLLEMKFWRHILGDEIPKRWTLEKISSGSLLAKVGSRRLRRILHRIVVETHTKEEAYPWWIRQDLMDLYRAWLKGQGATGLKILVERKLASE